MPRHTLTAKGLESKLAAAVDEAAAKNTRIRIADGDNLHLVVRANGGASWVLEYRAGGRRKPLTLGPWPTIGLKSARELAAEARAKVARGVDPLIEKRELQEAERAAGAAAAALEDTVRDLFDDWLRKHPGSAVYKGNILAAFTKDVFEQIGALAPHVVTREHCIKILRAIEGRGSHNMVRRVRMWMRQMFDFGIDHEERPQLQSNPVPMGTLRSFAQHDSGNYAAITRAKDVPALMKAIRVYPNIVVRACMLLSAYAWQRPSEVREATWAEFDLDGGLWRISPDRTGRKGGEEHLVPLATQVVELLRRHQGVVGRKGWLFPGRVYGRPLSEGAMEVALHSMGFKGKHTPHGFRAMARTILEEELKFDAKLMEKQLSHEYDPSGLSGAYNRAEYWGERVAMMQAWADWLDRQG